jgi:hypothetical protein
LQRIEELELQLAEVESSVVVKEHINDFNLDEFFTSLEFLLIIWILDFILTQQDFEAILPVDVSGRFFNFYWVLLILIICRLGSKDNHWIICHFEARAKICISLFAWKASVDYYMDQNLVDFGSSVYVHIWSFLCWQ